MQGGRRAWQLEQRHFGKAENFSSFCNRFVTVLYIELVVLRTHKG